MLGVEKDVGLFNFSKLFLEWFGGLCNHSGSDWTGLTQVQSCCFYPFYKLKEIQREKSDEMPVSP